MNIQKDTSAFVLIFFILVGNFILSFASFSFGENAGTNIPTLSLMTISTLLLFFIVTRIEPFKTWRQVPAWFLGFVGVFVVSAVSSLAFTYNTYATIYEIIRWFTGIASFFIVANLIYKTGALSKIGAAVVLAADFLVIMGISSFINSSNPGYLRFASVLIEHNIFAGFLLLPFCIALASFRQESKKIIRYFYAISSVVIGSALILTFSRGAWLSLLLSVIVGFIFLKPINSFKKIFTSSALSVFIVLCCISVSTLILYEMAVHTANQKNAVVGVYNGDAIPDVATFARLIYFKDALNLIKNNPLGVGLGNYADIAQITRSHVENFSFDPHNIYLKLATETGIVGGLSFIGFVIGLLYLLLKQNKIKFSGLSKAFIIGVLATLIHSAIDFDFSITANLCLFFMAAGAVYGDILLTASKTPTKSPIYPKIILVMLFALSIIVIPMYVASNASSDASYFEGKKEFDESARLYKKALTLFPFDYSSHYGLGQTYYDESLDATGTPKQQLLQAALDELAKAKHYKKSSSKIYDAESLSYEQLKDIPKATAALAQAVKFDPLNNLDKQTRLANLYLSQKQYNDIITLTEYTTAHFPPELFSNPIWSDPNQEAWRIDTVMLYGYMATAYEKTGNIQQSKLITQKIPAYSKR